MAQRLAYLEAVVGADVTQFRKGMREIRNDVGLLSEASRGLGAVARTLTYTVAAPLAAVGTYAFQAASDFDASMRNINAIAGMTEAELSKVSDSILEFGARNRSGAVESANALYTVYSAGIDEIDVATKTMESSVLTAEAGLADLGTTTESVVGSLLAFGYESENIEERLDQISNATSHMVNVGVGSMDEFASALGNVVPTAASVNMSIEELYGNMAFLTQRSLSPAKAATALNSALTALTKPTDAMNDAFQELGVNGMEQLIDKTGGVNAALVALIGTTNGTQVELQAMFNNIRGARAINLFAKDVDLWTEAIEKFEDKADGATLRAHAQQMKAVSAATDLAKSAMLSMGIVIGQELIPYLLPVIEAITDFGLGIENLEPELLKLAVSIGVAAVALPPLLWGLTSLISPLGAVLVPLGLVAGVSFENISGAPGIFTKILKSVVGTENLEKFAKYLGNIADILFPEDEEEGDLQSKVDEGLGTATVDLANVIKFTNTLDVNDSIWSMWEDVGPDLIALDPDMHWQKFRALVESSGLGIIDANGNLVIAGGMTIYYAFDGLSWTLTDAVPNITVDTETADRYERAVIQALGAVLTYKRYPSPVEMKNTMVVSGDNIEVDTTEADRQDALSKEIEKMGKVLTGMFTSALDWVVTDGVAIIAEKVGYVSGTIVGIISIGIGQAFDAVIGAVDDNKDKNAVSEIATYFEENVKDPFNKGLDDAVGDLGIVNPGQIFFTKLIASIWGLKIAGSGIVGALSFVFRTSLRLVDFATGGIARIVANKFRDVFIAKTTVDAIGGGVSGAMASATTSATATGIAATGITAKLAGAAAALGSAISGLIVVGIAAALVAGIVKVIYDSLDEAEKQIVDKELETGEPGAEGFRPAAMIGDALNPTSTPPGLPPGFGQVQEHDVTHIMGSDKQGTVTYTIKGMEDWVGLTDDEGGGAQKDATEKMIRGIINWPGGKGEREWDKYTDTGLALEAYGTEDLSKSTPAVRAFKDELIGLINETDVSGGQYFLHYVDWVDELGLNIDKLDDDKLKMAITLMRLDNVLPDLPETPTDMLGTPKEQKGIDTIPSEYVHNLAELRSAWLKEGNDEIIAALSGAWGISDDFKTLFTEEGAVPINLWDYINTKPPEEGLITEEMETLLDPISIEFETRETPKSVKTREEMEAFPTNMSTNYVMMEKNGVMVFAAIDASVNTHKTKVNELTTSYKDLNTEISKAAPYIDIVEFIPAKIITLGASDSTGEHYSGLDYVPYDNYGANLHKGEAVLNRDEADMYRKGGNTTTTTINNITINGVQDVETLIEEMDRRNIQILGYKR